MTKKDFRQYLLKGRGCCIQAVREDPERYRSEVLWACSHEIAFDAQCEGSRAWYVYTMIECYEDKSPFLNALITALDNSTSRNLWKMQYFAEALMHFALDGSGEAEAALWRKYEALYAFLRNKKRQPRRYFAERDDYSSLCIDLGQRREAMVRIAEDIGRLYRENPIYNGWYFDWLYACNGKRILKTLEKKAEKSENIGAYLLESRRVEEEELKNQENRKASARLRSIRLEREGDPEKIQECVDSYLRAEDPEARADALGVFCRCPYPGDLAPVMEDTRSENAHLRFAAWRVLEHIRHPQVREFALAHMAEEPENCFALLLRNYEQKDAAYVTEMVKTVPTDHACTTIWHGLHLDVLNMEDYGLKSPRELLRYIYETTYCPNCREVALRQMGKRHMLTQEMLEECQFDSYDYIRNYAKRCLRRRKAE